MELTSAIPVLRESAVAVLRVHAKPPASYKKGEVRTPEFELSFGSGFCVVPDRYVVTACHVLGYGNPRDEDDRFYALVVPANGDPAYHFPVVGFPLERQDLDIAVLEIGPCATNGIHLPAIPVAFAPQADGTRAVTLGYPAPEVHGANIDPQGNFISGQFFLKSHANEGIVSAQYELGELHIYELNVGWHHGESGGLIASIDTSPAAFSIMQQYRNVQTPHGTVAGPHRGVALSAIEPELRELGVASL